MPGQQEKGDNPFERYYKLGTEVETNSRPVCQYFSIAALVNAALGVWAFEVYFRSKEYTCASAIAPAVYSCAAVCLAKGFVEICTCFQVRTVFRRVTRITHFIGSSLHPERECLLEEGMPPPESLEAGASDSDDDLPTKRATQEIQCEAKTTEVTDNIMLAACSSCTLLCLVVAWLVYLGTVSSYVFNHSDECAKEAPGLVKDMQAWAATALSSIGAQVLWYLLIYLGACPAGHGIFWTYARLNEILAKQLELIKYTQNKKVYHVWKQQRRERAEKQALRKEERSSAAMQSEAFSQTDRTSHTSAHTRETKKEKHERRERGRLTGRPHQGAHNALGKGSVDRFSQRHDDDESRRDAGSEMGDSAIGVPSDHESQQSQQRRFLAPGNVAQRIGLAGNIHGMDGAPRTAAGGRQRRQGDTAPG